MSGRTAVPHLDGVRAAHRAVARAVDGLTDALVAGPSRLPGWSRGHVLAHLADNARVFAEVAEAASRGELIELYDGGATERDAIIEVHASRPAAVHIAELAERTARLEAVWARMTHDDWRRPVLFRNGDVAGTTFTRWREAWIHLVDLDLGFGPDAWPADFAAHAIDFLHTRLPAGHTLTASDLGRAWPSPEAAREAGAGAGIVVTGGVRDLAAWLAGRRPLRAPTAPGGLPDLGPWPPHPPRAADRVPTAR